MHRHKTHPCVGLTAENFDFQAYVTKMTLGTLFFCADLIDKPFKKDVVRFLLEVDLIVTLMTSYKTLSSAKNSSIGLRSGE